VTGEEIEEIVSGLFKLDSAMVAKLKNVLVPSARSDDKKRKRIKAKG
jgi:hypothetical protein